MRWSGVHDQRSRSTQESPGLSAPDGRGFFFRLGGAARLARQRLAVRRRRSPLLGICTADSRGLEQCPPIRFLPPKPENSATTPTHISAPNWRIVFARAARGGERQMAALATKENATLRGALKVAARKVPRASISDRRLAVRGSMEPCTVMHAHSSPSQAGHRREPQVICLVGGRSPR